MEMLGLRFESVRVCSVLGSAASATLHKPLNGRDGGLHLSPANLEAQLEDGAYTLVMLWHDDGINCHPDFLNTFWAKAPAKRGCEACLLPERGRELEAACLRSMTRSDNDESMRAASAELPVEATKPFAPFVPPRDAPPNLISGTSSIPAGTGIPASSRRAMMRGALFEGSRRDDEKKKADERVGKLNESYESAKQAATNSSELASLAKQRENDLTLQLKRAEERVDELRTQLASATLDSEEKHRVAEARATAAAQSHSELEAAVEQQRLYRLAFEFATGETDDMAWAVNPPHSDYALVAEMLANMPFVTGENEAHDVNDKGKGKEVTDDELGGTIP